MGTMAEKSTEYMRKSQDGVWDLLPATSMPVEILDFLEERHLQNANSGNFHSILFNFAAHIRDSVILNGYYGQDTVLHIPSVINGKHVIGLTRYALYKDPVVRKLTDDDGHWDGEVYYERVTSAEITDIVLPEGILYLDDQVFSDIPTLENISLPESLMHIGLYCFAHTNIQEIKLPQKIASVSQSCFHECLNLSKVKLGEHIYLIESEAFDGCLSLKEIDLPQSLAEIKGSAFARSGLTHINLPSGLKTIHIHAFANCFDLEYCCIPRSVNHIDDHSFSWYVEKMNREGYHRYENVNNPTTTLFVYPGSYAHMWAVQHGHKVASAEL